MPEAVRDVPLGGCTPEPLMAYLKALGILRLVAEQKSVDVRCRWKRGVFHIESALDESEMVRFFLEDYCPTPLVAPWGARSGFYQGESEKTARDALGALTASPNPRLSSFRAVVIEVQAMLKRHDFEDKPKDEKAKLRLLQACRSELPDEVVPWLDAAFTLSTEWRSFPPLLGTGGNEGSQGYSSTFYQMLGSLGFAQAALRPEARTLLRHALFGESTGNLVEAPAGQLDPGRAGGYNQGFGIVNENALVNPWEMILAFEGTLLWTSSSTRILNVHIRSRNGGSGGMSFSSPFTVRCSKVGFTSCSGKEVNGPRDAEVWAPIWVRSVGYGELKQLISEGRADVGRERARSGVEFAEAASSLGVDRGVTEFARYSLLQRRGDNYVAVPSGRFPVRERRESDLVRQLGPVLGRLDRFFSS